MGRGDAELAELSGQLAKCKLPSERQFELSDRYTVDTHSECEESVRGWQQPPRTYSMWPGRLLPRSIAAEPLFVAVELRRAARVEPIHCADGQLRRIGQPP